MDDAIDAILGGELQAAAFPPIEVVHRFGKIYSISNRRLFMWRALASLGVVARVDVIVLDAAGARLKAIRWDGHLRHWGS